MNIHIIIVECQKLFKSYKRYSLFILESIHFIDRILKKYFKSTFSVLNKSWQIELALTQINRPFKSTDHFLQKYIYYQNTN